MQNTETDSAWEFWVDRGGTFTDIVARRPDGVLVTHKLLSERPGHYRDAAIAGIRHLLGVASDAPLPAARVKTIKMGTTVATNALLERKGEPTLLAITAGHADALRIGAQNRPRLFDLNIKLHEPVYAETLEIDERVTADGTVLHALDTASARAGLQAAYHQGLRSVAIVLLHAYRSPEHEIALAEIARDVGFTQISTSHEVSPLMKLVGRGDTTVVDAYLSPIVHKYVAQVRDDLADSVELLFMQSNGGLTDARYFRGRDAILSGPAGGIVGMAETSRAAGFEKVIGFDMGGTSTDVSHFAGAFERTNETVVAGARIRTPMMRIHTVAAGGGSICWFDGARFRVGPHSAGAEPGPACYRRGGPLTITDCNVLLGKLQADFFPAIFGPNADQPIDHLIVRTRFEEMAADIAAASGARMSPEEIAEGFLKIAVANMASAIRRISIERGYDISRYALACFGGAGGQHACLVADALNMERVIIHPLAGVLSAYGMGLADRRALREASVELALTPANNAAFERTFSALESAARADLARQGAAAERITCTQSANVRYAGTDTALSVTIDTIATIAQAFDESHRRRFGFTTPETGLIVESLVVEAIAASQERPAERDRTKRHQDASVESAANVQAHMAGRIAATPLYQRTELVEGATIDGPAIICEATATTVLEPEWRARLEANGVLVLERVKPLTRRVQVGEDVDPVMLEVFNNLFTAVAEQMGHALQNTAYSVNIKERLDFSCALFDSDGALVANAPHMPVHLGSMGESVKAIMSANAARMKAGDVFMLNDPFAGGTHLPDITVVAPFFEKNAAQPLFYVAARGHHADIGGITPGSMPPQSRNIGEEGILIENFLLVENGRFREQEARALLATGPYPARNPTQNIGDLKAQTAACMRGSEELRAMVETFGRNVVLAYMKHVQDNAAESVRRALTASLAGHCRYEMDDGAAIEVRISVDENKRSAVVDFAGTSAQLASNFNAPLAVCRAAVMYVFRTLVDDDIPMNDGCLRPIEIRVPEGCLLRPKAPAAVVAGNVETSQAVTDALFSALGVLAASQGTMNNFTFGDGALQYYETICGGAGAGRGFDGASAVQTHMTNSRLTDPEVLEWRYPVLVRRFAIRCGSGGEGHWRGGAGVVREIEFRAAMSAAILSNRRRVAPFGLEGGGPAACGINSLHRANGATEILPGTGVMQVEPGDRFVIETPGGGGFGAAADRPT